MKRKSPKRRPKDRFDITIDDFWLGWKGACYTGLVLFRKRFPKGLKLTQANLMKVSCLYPLYEWRGFINWFATRILSNRERMDYIALIGNDPSAHRYARSLWKVISDYRKKRKNK